MLIAAGAAGFENWLEMRAAKTQQLGFGVLWGLQVIGSLIAIVLVKPIAPINSALWKVTAGVNEEVTLYGNEYGLPPIISGVNGLWYRG
jgi:hypothetical protein